MKYLQPLLLYQYLLFYFLLKTNKTLDGESCGPGYRSPLDAMLHGPREKILYTVCVSVDPNKPDVLSTVDVDPESPTFCQVNNRDRTFRCKRYFGYFMLNFN